jgi:hypothetical protein
MHSAMLQFSAVPLLYIVIQNFTPFVQIRCVRKVAVHLGVWVTIPRRRIVVPVDITSNNFYKCTATFRTHCIMYTPLYAEISSRV